SRLHWTACIPRAEGEEHCVNAMPAVRTVSGRLRQRGLRESAARVLRKAVRIPLLPITTRVLQGRVKQVTTIDDALDLAYTFSFGGVAFDPWQERSGIGGVLLRVVGARTP